MALPVCLRSLPTPETVLQPDNNTPSDNAMEKDKNAFIIKSLVLNQIRRESQKTLRFDMNSSITLLAMKIERDFLKTHVFHWVKNVSF